MDTSGTNAQNAPKSISIDEKEKTVKILLNPRLYSQSAILAAAYRFTGGFDVIVEGDPINEIMVFLKIKKEDAEDAKRCAEIKNTLRSDLEALSNAFFSELLHSSVEESQARRYADTRNALIGAALRGIYPAITAEDAIKLQKNLENRKNPEKSGK